LLLRSKIGEILEAVETRQLEGTLRSREETLDFVKSEYSLGAKNYTKARFSSSTFFIPSPQQQRGA
jgi:hypothetical protein